MRIINETDRTPETVEHYITEPGLVSACGQVRWETCNDVFLSMVPDDAPRCVVCADLVESGAVQ